MSDVKGFLKFARVEPKKFALRERVANWREFYQVLDHATLREQAARCMDCGVPFCQGTPDANPQKSIGCPVENLIPDWNDLVHQDHWEAALKALHSTNNFPEFTGKLCPAPCEASCVLGITSDPVSIRTIESAIIDRGFQEGWVEPMPSKTKSGKTIAIVGSGPAGLAAAQQLARSGHSVTVFEKAPRPGGLLRYGIPEFKMEKAVLNRRLEQMEKEGVIFKNRIHVGVDLKTDQLRKDFDAICLTLGAEAARELPILGRDLKGIYPALEYLTHQNLLLENTGFNARPELNAFGKKVVVIGGGDTGSDCIGTAHRQGCASVIQLEILSQPPLVRSPQTPWPLWPLKLRSSHAHEEGAERYFSVLTRAFLGESGHVKSLLMHKSGELQPGQSQEFKIEADLVLLAMGFTGPVKNTLIEPLNLALDPRGNLLTNASYMTSEQGVFAAGDVRRGASLIVWAISEGRKMAASVDRYLKFKT